MSTLLTYEEWWRAEGKRRRERPYTAETSIKHVWKCNEHQRDCGICWSKYGQLGGYEKAIVRKEQYQYSFDNPQALL